MKYTLIVFLLCFAFITSAQKGSISTKNDTSFKSQVLSNQIGLDTAFLCKCDGKIQDLLQRTESLEQEATSLKSIKENTTNTEIWVSLTSVLVAFGLLIITFQNNKESRRILQRSILEQQKVNKAQLRPILHAYRTGWKEKTGLILVNYGQGPAAVKEIFFEREGEKVSSISDFINIKSIDKDVWWDQKWNFQQDEYFFYPQQKEEVYLLTRERLIQEYNKSENEAHDIIDEIRTQRKGIKLVIKYSDLLDYQEGTTEYYSYEMALDYKIPKEQKPVANKTYKQ